MDFRELQGLYARHISAPYIDFLVRSGLDLDIVQASGATLVDRAGREYIDCIAGYGNLNVGHNHPQVIQAVVAELRSPRPFNWPFPGEAQVRLAERLAALAPRGLECCQIVNSGAEAVESALKLARLATGKPHVVAMLNAWHGFTLGALAVSEPGMRKEFGQILPEVTHVRFGDIGQVREALRPDTAALIVEPIQSEAGAVVPPAGYLASLASLCRESGVLLIVDEIKSGLGKTGLWFACQRDGVQPDMLLVGKSLGGGVMPIGALLARREIWSKFGLSFGMSASSAAGNAPACAAGLAALGVLAEGLVERAGVLGVRLLAGLRSLAGEHPSVVCEARGCGLLAALELRTAALAASIVRSLPRLGVIAMTAFCRRTAVLLEPPFVTTEAQIAAVLEALQKSLGAAEAHPGG